MPVESNSKSSKLGLKEVIAMGVGGMVSGGIYAVLGIAMDKAGNAVPLSFLLGGIVALITAYSYVQLTKYFQEGGGVFSFLKHSVRNRHVAGLFGWLLIIGYIGTIAMYAYGFGAYATSFFDLPQNSIYRQAISVLIIVIISTINIIGVKTSGLFEDIAVYIKIFLLLSLGGLGIYFAPEGVASISNFFNKGVISPISAFAIIFVSYEGFQLLTYDYEDIKNVEENLPKGIYGSIIIAILIYITVSVMVTLQLTPDQLLQHKEYALAKAVAPFLGSAGFIIVVISAMKSTSSGINATLFGTARFAKKVATEKELPRFFSMQNKEGEPVAAIITIGILTALFSVLGGLEQITEFSSVVFLITFGAVNYINLVNYKKTNSNAVLPLLGLAGIIIALILVFNNIYQTEPHTFYFILAVLFVVIYIEFIHMERKEIEEVVLKIEQEAEEVEEELEETAKDIYSDREE